MNFKEYETILQIINALESGTSLSIEWSIKKLKEMTIKYVNKRKTRMEKNFEIIITRLEKNSKN